MRKIIILFSAILVVTSCNYGKKKSDKVLSYLNSEMENISLSDSLFIGEPLAADAEFIRNVEAGGDNYRYFEQFGNILKNHNKKYVNYKSNGFIKTLKVSDKLTLELKRKKYSSKDKNSDIQIVLFTKINDAVKDSIVFYKYQLDQDFPKEQRFETLAFLDNNLEVFKLESYSGLSEFAFQAEKWEKFKINSSNGKIELIRKLNYKDSGNTKNPTTGKINLIEELNPASGVNEESYEGDEVEDEENTSNNKEIDYSFKTLKGSWSYDCENASSLKINDEKLLIPVISNQYYIHLTRIGKKNDACVFKYKLEIMEGLGSQDENSKDYFNDTEIAIVKIIDNNTIEFNWLGFYNKSNKQRQYTDPHFGDQNPIILKKCEYGNSQ